MENKNLNLNLDELWTLRCLVSAEMLKASKILDKTGNSSDTDDRKIFDYWHDKFQALKSSYDKLFKISYDRLCGDP